LLVRAGGRVCLRRILVDLSEVHIEVLAYDVADPPARLGCWNRMRLQPGAVRVREEVFAWGHRAVHGGGEEVGFGWRRRRGGVAAVAAANEQERRTESQKESPTERPGVRGHEMSFR